MKFLIRRRNHYINSLMKEIQKRFNIEMSIPSAIRPGKIGFIVLFGVVGVLCRYCINVLVVQVFKIDNFWGTMFINILGCCLIAIFQILAVEQGRLGDDLRIGIMVGLFGGFTTFSGYALDAILLFDERKTIKIIYGVLSLILTPAIGFGLGIGAFHLTRFLSNL
jgi:CrcB protein